MHWTRRLRTWLITAVVAGLTVGITTLVSHSVDSGATAVQHLFKPAGSGAAISDTLSSNGLTINWSVQQGIGCEGSGDVYPVSETPGLNLKTRPGSGPTHGDKTWDQDPRAFGAVPVNPRMTLSLTGPTNHAVTITGLKFHVISRKPQVVGPWLDAESGCGGGGIYHYGLVDFDTPAPYYLPPKALPDWARADALKFPYTTTANDPELLMIDVRMEHCDCTWDATLTWIDGNATRSKVFLDKGHPFETTSMTNNPGTNWENLSRSGAPSGWTASPLRPN